jgi:hypothetical protein
MPENVRLGYRWIAVLEISLNRSVFRIPVREKRARIPPEYGNTDPA